MYLARAPVRFLYSLGGEDRLVQVDYPVMMLLQRVDAVLDANPPLFIFSLFVWINPFVELDALPLDLILLVELRQQCRVEYRAVKVSLE